MVTGSVDESGGGVGIVSGSGIDLRSVLERVDEERRFHEVIGVGGGAVKGHDGVFLRGACGSTPVVLQCGRIHLYEGHGPDVVASTVDALGEMGVRRIIFTNAVGGLAPDLAPGALVAATQVVPWRFTPHTFPEALIPELRVPGCDRAGVMYWMHGPCYETRAEIEALRRLGGLTVGMSLPAELARCGALGIPCGVVSCVTNDCTRHDAVLTHEEVVETASRASTRLARLLREYLAGD